MAAKGAYGMDQDFYPWSPIITRPVLRWPDNARVALAVIVNLEHGGGSTPPSEGCVGWRGLERQSHRRSFAITMLTARKEHVRKTSVDRAISIMTAVTAARI